MDELRTTPARSAPFRRLRALSYLFIGGALLGLVAVTFFPLPTDTNLLGTRLTAACRWGSARRSSWVLGGSRPG